MKAPMNTKQAAAYIGRSEGWLRTKGPKAGITMYKPAGRIIYYQEDLDTWLVSCPILPKSEPDSNRHSMDGRRITL